MNEIFKGIYSFDVVAYNTAKELLVTYSPVISLGLIAVVLGLIVALARQQTRGKAMSMRELELSVGEGIVERVEDAYHKGRITKAQRKLMYKKLYDTLDLKDLIPAEEHERNMKKRIKDHLFSWYGKATVVSKVVSKPVEAVVEKKRVLFAHVS